MYEDEFGKWPELPGQLVLDMTDNVFSGVDFSKCFESQTSQGEKYV